MVLTITDTPDMERFVVYLDGERRPMTRCSFRLLMFLAESKMCQDGWLSIHDPRVDVNIYGYLYRMKQELESDPGFIVNNGMRQYKLRDDCEVRIDIDSRTTFDDVTVEKAVENLLLITNKAIEK